jgi:hypothetical protein
MAYSGAARRNPRPLPPIRAMAIAMAILSALAAGAPAQEVPGFRYWNPRDTASVPKTLSALGIYRQAPGKGAELIPEAHAFEINTPSYNDGAKVRRWVILKPGRSIGYREKDDYWAYPDSAVFVQELSIDTNALDSNSRVLWETRVLVSAKEAVDERGTLSDRWYGYSYRWRKDQQDADRVEARFGMDASIRVWPQGTGPGRVSAVKKWHFLSIYECERCHHAEASLSDSAHGRAVLGFFTAQLNRPYPGPSPTLNQLEYFFQEKVLSGTRSDWGAAPRWRGLRDSAFAADAWTSLDFRARSYIAAECSNCHGRRGIGIGAAAGVDFDADFHTLEPRTEFRNTWTSWAYGLDTLPPLYYPKDDPANPGHLDTMRIVPAWVVPGHPEKSVLLFRLRARNAQPGNYDAVRDQMPLRTYEADSLAIDLLTRWIRGMATAPAAALAPARRTAAPSIRVQGRILRVVPLGAESGARVELVSLAGRKAGLRPLGGGVYEVPAGLPKGVYLARMGRRSVLLSLF